MPTQLPPNLTPQQEKIYISMEILSLLIFVVQLQIEDISRRLKCGDLGIPKNPEDRSAHLFSLFALAYCRFCFCLLYMILSHFRQFHFGLVGRTTVSLISICLGFLFSVNAMLGSNYSARVRL